MEGNYIEILNTSSNATKNNDLLELSSFPLGSSNQVQGVAKFNDLLTIGSSVGVRVTYKYAFNDSLAGEIIVYFHLVRSVHVGRKIMHIIYSFFICFEGGSIVKSTNGNYGTPQ